ncbi:MAG: hypothetical protein NW220_02325 [Leptolyngbyaceae cyanobacterium bins.349]|nr:hypothetical protein [Leptolyngbyaceae cyanobacterium bins.349]
MRYQTELYGLVATFERDQRIQAYDLANSCATAPCCAIVTVSTQYKVWIRLTSSEYACWQAYINQPQSSAFQKPEQKPEKATATSKKIYWPQPQFLAQSFLTEAFA